MVTVRQLLEGKPGDLWSIRPDDSVYSALIVMADKRVGALLVMEGGNLVGIVSERDYARKVVLEGKSSKETKVREIMTSRVCHVDPTYGIEECMALMTEKSVRHLPVLEEGKLVGIVSIGDVVKAVISEQEFIIERLEQYISGR